MNHLFKEFKCFEGQPVKIFTDDGKTHTGIDINALEDAVRIIDNNGRLVLIEYRHIDAVVEPQMRLNRFCNEDCGRFDRGDDYDHGERP